MIGPDPSQGPLRKQRGHSTGAPPIYNTKTHHLSKGFGYEWGIPALPCPSNLDDWALTADLC